MQLLRTPERYVLVADGVFAVGSEGEVLLAALKQALELVGEARVLAPEEANVRHLEEHHGKALEAQAKGPPGVLVQVAVLQNLLPHHPAPQHLEPGAVEEDFELQTRFCEREVRLYPPHLDVAEDSLDHPRQRLPKVSHDQRDCLFVRRDTQLRPTGDTHAIHLMEAEVVAGVNGVSAVDIPCEQKRSVSFAEERRLVCSHVRA
mmetsp:Transcript_10218/g.23927  ORF Transcript_10218/g.23927 Transcript_10218/m.23927 type:complete len:204 (-) Transcript_10218:81-692(-)